MTTCGFCVVAALSSQTSGRPFTRSRKIGKSFLMVFGSNWRIGAARSGTSSGWKSVTPIAGAAVVHGASSGVGAGATVVHGASGVGAGVGAAVDHSVPGVDPGVGTTGGAAPGRPGAAGNTWPGIVGVVDG